MYFSSVFTYLVHVINGMTTYRCSDITASNNNCCHLTCRQSQAEIGMNIIGPRAIGERLQCSDLGVEKDSTE